MRVVVDCSVVASFLLEDEQHPYGLQVKKLFGQAHIMVPALFWPEIASVFLHRERRRLMEPAKTDFMIAGLERSAMTTAPLVRMPLLLDYSRNYKLTPYDAAYLALAKEYDAGLATLDEDLKKAAISENLYYNPA